MAVRVDHDPGDDFDHHVVRFHDAFASFLVRSDVLSRTWIPTVHAGVGGAPVDAVHVPHERRLDRHPFHAVEAVPDHHDLPVLVFEAHEHRRPGYLEVDAHHEAYHDHQSRAQHVRELSHQAPSIDKVQPLGSATTWT
tara:strand:+ start:1085 stop:1498 length:414 start_codon:yes stop_codon:yes gene_type:complete